MDATSNFEWMYIRRKGQNVDRAQAQHKRTVPYCEIAGQKFSPYTADNFGRMVDLANAVANENLPQLGRLWRYFIPHLRCRPVVCSCARILGRPCVVPR